MQINKANSRWNGGVRLGVHHLERVVGVEGADSIEAGQQVVVEVELAQLEVERARRRRHQVLIGVQRGEPGWG